MNPVAAILGSGYTKITTEEYEPVSTELEGMINIARGLLCITAGAASLSMQSLRGRVSLEEEAGAKDLLGIGSYLVFQGAARSKNLVITCLFVLCLIKCMNPTQPRNPAEK